MYGKAGNTNNLLADKKYSKQYCKKPGERSFKEK
jgi:hypothetical protein